MQIVLLYVSNMWPLMWKRSLWFAVLKRIAVRKPFISCSNGMGCRSNGLSYPFKNNYNRLNDLSYPFKKNWESFEWLELSVQKKLGAVSNGLSYPLKKNWEPFERLELYLSKKLWAVWTGCSWQTAGDMFWNRSLQFLWKGCFEPWSCQS